MLIDHKLDIQAVIFDMDGLMFDTERLSQSAWETAALEYGFAFPEGVFKIVIGRSLPEVSTVLLSEFGAEFPFAEVLNRKQTILEKHLKTYGLPRKPGLEKLLVFLKSNNLRIAVASSSYCEIISRNLTLAGLEELKFDSIIGGDEVDRGKPAPDIFLKASQSLCIPVKNCLVLEDSNAGILAAFRAGSIPVMIPDLIPADKASQRMAYRIFDSLIHVTEWLGNSDE